MAQTTENLGLTLPDLMDNVLLEVINENMEIIDEAEGDMDERVAGKMNKPENAGEQNKILRNDGQGGSVWADAATQQEIGEAVTAWLDENVPAGQTVVVDASLSIAGAAADAKKTGDEIAALKNEAGVIEENIFYPTEREDGTAVSGYRLNESDGLCTANAGFKLVKYTVTAGDVVKVVSDDRFQFQTAESVPTTGTSNRVGVTYGAGTFVLKVPATATYLVVSTPTESTAKVYGTKSVKDAIGDLPEGETVQGEIEALVEVDEANFKILDGKKANSDSLYLYKEASGEVVTVEDAAPEIAKQLRIEVAPVQDLHGYDHPWPAGGGKNICPYATAGSKDGLTWTVDSFGVITLSGTATANVDIDIPVVIPAGTSIAFGYHNSRSFSNAEATMYIICESGGNPWSYVVENAVGTATLEQNSTKFRLRLYSGLAISGSTKLYPHIEVGNTLSAFTPYSNICPISGWDWVEVTRTGKNLIGLKHSPDRSAFNNGVTVSDETDEHFTLTSNGQSWRYRSLYYPLKAGTYTLSLKATSTTPGYVPAIGTFYPTDAYGISTPTGWDNASPSSPLTFTLTEDRVIEFRFFATTGTATTQSVTFYDVQLEHGSNASEFDPYESNAYEIDFPSSAGTVYGGELTVNRDGTGTLVVDRADVDLGTMDYSYDAQNTRFYTSLPSDAAHPASGTDAEGIISSQYTASLSEKNGTMFRFFSSAAGARLFIKNLNYTNASDFKTAMSGVQLVYELATPVSYTLTAPQVMMLLGLNNLWADTGAIESLLYAVNNNAQKDGTYEDLTAGNAQYLLSDRGDTDVEPYVFRKTGGSKKGYGRELLRKVVGGTVAWNQLIYDGNFPTGTTYWTKGGSKGTFAIANGEGTLTLGGDAWNNDIRQSNYKYVNFIENHKYLIMLDYLMSSGLSGKTLRIARSSYNTGIDIPYSATFARHGEVINASSNLSGNTSMRVTLWQDGSSLANEYFKIKNFCCFDLTQMFGSTIADAIYAMEQATAGAGVAWFRKLFPKVYYAYDAGSLQSVQTSGHELTGFNQWDEEWENGTFNSSGVNENDGTKTYLRSKNLIRCLPNTKYDFASNKEAFYVGYYDANKNFIQRESYAQATNFTTLADAYYIRFWCYKSNNGYATYQGNEICVSLYLDGERDGEYELYKEYEYPLGNVELRGIPKWDSVNGLYYDGDEYEPDGKVTRRYGVVDLGTLTWNASSGAFYSTDLADTIKVPASTSVIGNYICSKLSQIPAGTTLEANQYAVAQNGRLWSKDSTSATPSAFATAMSGVYLVYELATPTTETAEPYRELEISAKGGTEEFIDAGSRDVAIPVGHETFYPIDVVAYIEELTNPDHDMIADSNISSGKYFMVGNSLYLSTAAIAQGAAIIPGTNCTATSLAEALNAINQ